MAEIVIKDGGSQTVQSSSSSMKMSSSSSSSTSSSSTKMQMSSSSQQSSQTQVSSSSSSTSKKMVSSSKTVSSSSSSFSSFSSSSSVSIQSSSSSFADTFSKQLGLDPSAEVLKLRGDMDEKVAAMRREMLRLMPLEMGAGADTITKIDSDSIKNYMDKDNNDRLRFNFDVNEFQSESINIKCDGNKIEVHAKKTSKKGDEEASDEYSRTYELPTSKPIDTGSVTSSFFKDGVLTVELPVDAVESK